MQTFMADDDGRLLADCYVANNDEELILLCEAAAPDDLMARIIREADREGIAQDLTDSHVLLSVDGFKAWAVVKDLFGADVLGLPYLSVELYPFADEQVYLFRAGKTSEFGYLLLAPQSVAEPLFEAVREAVARQAGEPAASRPMTPCASRGGSSTSTPRGFAWATRWPWACSG